MTELLEEPAVREICGEMTDKNLFVPFTLNFATPAKISSFTTQEEVDKMGYDPTLQVNLSTMNPQMGSRSTKDSKSTSAFIGRDFDRDQQNDD